VCRARVRQKTGSATPQQRTGKVGKERHNKTRQVGGVAQQRACIWGWVVVGKGNRARNARRSNVTASV